MKYIILIYILIIIGVLISIIFFQGWLARQKNNYFGLIIPCILFIVSIVLTVSDLGIGYNKYTINTNNETYTFSLSEKEEFDNKIKELRSADEDFEAKHPMRTSINLKELIVDFFGINLLNIILITVYYFNRKKYKLEKESYKKSIQDL